MVAFANFKYQAMVTIAMALPDAQVPDKPNVSICVEGTLGLTHYSVHQGMLNRSLSYLGNMRRIHKCGIEAVIRSVTLRVRAVAETVLT